MDVATPIVTAVAKRIPGVLLKLLSGKKEDYLALFESRLGNHLAWVARWSAQIQFYGMVEPEDTDTSTIALKMATIPRRFRGPNKTASPLDEGALLCGATHYMLLGDPGAGKTTTLKRLSRTLLLSEPLSDSDTWQYPIVIRFRDLESGIVQSLADIFGIRYKHRRIKRPITFRDAKGRPRVKNQVFLEPYCGMEPLVDVVKRTLEATAPIVFLDGLDEVSPDRRDPLEGELSALALGATNCKLVVSCRSGDYTRHMGGFSIAEVCPLEPEDIDKLAHQWLDAPTEFLAGLKDLPFYDLASRPLFLTQLIVFYKRYGYLPDRPSDVYGKMLGLLLEDWDAQRGIHRKSKYAGFTPLKKAEFLAALAYQITYKVKAKVFDRDILVSAYQTLRKAFGLPKHEASDVAQEIETHTGIVVQGSGDRFEFSHLSLQEYLCASYLSRAPLADHFGEYLVQYSAPLAVMVAISSDSSNTLAAVLLAPETYKEIYGRNVATLVSFMIRLQQEKPYFVRSTYLGLVLLRLIFYEDDDLLSAVEVLLKDQEVRLSICDALAHYVLKVDSPSPQLWRAKRVSYFDPAKKYKVEAPDSGLLPTQILESLRKTEGLATTKRKENPEYVSVKLPEAKGNDA